MGADKVLLFVRSIDRAEQEAIGIELEEDDGANGLTEDWYARGWMTSERVKIGGRHAMARHHRRKRSNDKKRQQGSASKLGLRRRTQPSRQCSRTRKE